MILRKLTENAHENVSYITVQFLKQLKVRVTSTTITDSVENHPDYPSLFSISDSLKKWKVENLALQVEPVNLDKLPVPFLAHIGKAGGSFVLVNAVDETVNYIDGNGKIRTQKRDEFIRDWTGNVLLAEASNDSGQKDYQTQRKKEILDILRMPAILLASIGLILLYGLSHINELVWSLVSLAVKLTGVVVTSLILLYELDNLNPFAKRICRADKNLNCKAVLGSKHAKLFNLVGWGQIGFFYFAGGFLYSLLGQGFQLAFLSWLNLVALPYIAFSVLYQWRVARQWCLLCLTVQALLAVEGMLSFINYWNVFQPSDFSINELVPLLTSFLLPIFFWLATQKVYTMAVRGKQYRKEVSQFKYNKDIFYSLLSKQKKISSPIEGLGVTLGNPSAKNTIIKVCNPYCGPCANAHPVIDEILEQNEEVKVQIIFNATNNENDIKAKPASHLLALYKKNDQKLIHMALDTWYNAKVKDYKLFADKYPLNGELDEQAEDLRAMSDWCRENGITFTPTFFINGRQLPETYRIEDLKYLL